MLGVFFDDAIVHCRDQLSDSGGRGVDNGRVFAEAQSKRNDKQLNETGVDAM
jgi:hypothetical protein